MRRLFVASVVLCLILCGCASEVDSFPTESKPPTFWEQVENKMEENEAAMREYQERQESIPKISLFEKVVEDPTYTRAVYYRETHTDILYMQFWNGDEYTFTPVVYKFFRIFF